MGRGSADHDPFSDLDITNDRIGRWHPLNQSLYVGYKVMLAGLLMISKGDRIAMHSSVETRYPFLDDDVIAFCASIAPEYKLHGMTEKWLLRRVAARTLPAADRQPAQDDVPRQPLEDLPRRPPPGLGRPAPEPRVARARPAISTPTAVAQQRRLPDDPAADHPAAGSSSTSP